MVSVDDDKEQDAGVLKSANGGDPACDPKRTFWQVAMTLMFVNARNRRLRLCRAV